MENRTRDVLEQFLATFMILFNKESFTSLCDQLFLCRSRAPEAEKKVMLNYIMFNVLKENINVNIFKSSNNSALCKLTAAASTNYHTNMGKLNSRGILNLNSEFT